MARKIKSTIYRFSKKNSNKIFEIGKGADFSHLYVSLQNWIK
jgi:hypothetical protein